MHTSVCLEKLAPRQRNAGLRWSPRRWTLGLAVAGLIGCPGRGVAEEGTEQLWTALSATTIRGYVSTSAHWNPGTGNGVVSPVVYNSPDKQDGFNLNVVDLEIERPLDEALWAAGYKAQLWFGQDAWMFRGNPGWVPSGDRMDFAIRQAYLALRAPVGNGLDFKLGVFDPIVGYESHDAGANPNYTRAYSTTIEPYSHTGLLMSYQFSPWLGASLGIANTLGPTINERANPPKAESYKTYMSSVTLTAPENWGFVSGSTVYLGAVNGYRGGENWDETLWFAGVTLTTPWKFLKVGASYDYLGTTDELDGNSSYANAVAGYLSFQLSDRLSLHGRAEYAWTDTDLLGSAANLPGGNTELFALTGTVQYDLWRNVISRLEVRWDHQAGDDSMTGFGGPLSGFGGGGFGDPGTKRNTVLVAANIIYVF